jgi:magnesium transporter
MAQTGAPKSISSSKVNKIDWMMVRKNDTKSLKYLKDEFDFNDIDLNDVGPPIQSPKIAYRNDYAFMVLQYPVYNNKNGDIHTAEVNFFILKNRLITVDITGVVDLQQLFRDFSSGILNVDNIPKLTYLLVNTLNESTYPLLRVMTTDIEKIEDRMFEDYKREFIKNLLRVKTNIVRARQAVQGQDDILKKLQKYFDDSFKNHKKLDVYFTQLIDDTIDIKNRLLLKKETIDALHETHQSLSDFRTNEIIKTLTIVSFVVFPLSLLAGIFGMNAVNMPIVQHEYGFYILIGIMLGGCFAMLSFFKYKKWM